MHDPRRGENTLVAHFSLLHHGDEIGVLDLGRFEEFLAAVTQVLILQCPPKAVIQDVHALYPALIHQLAKLVIGDSFELGTLKKDRMDRRHEKKDEQEIPNRKTGFLIHVLSSPTHSGTRRQYFPYYKHRTRKGTGHEKKRFHRAGCGEMGSRGFFDILSAPGFMRKIQ